MKCENHLGVDGTCIFINAFHDIGRISKNRNIEA
jgi:hypothetical protein